MTGAAPSYDVVIPTVGRSSLRDLLGTLEAVRGTVVVVDDRSDATAALDVPGQVKVLRGAAAGPAAARNAGWRGSDAEWVAFLDDDVAPRPDWVQALERDLAACGPNVAATQGRVTVPLPHDRPPSDWERNVAGLEHARWATADMAYRRRVLDEVGGFDERFPAAYREDADLGLRVTSAGYDIVRGRREVAHPVRPADRWVSVRLQRGNADDVLMRRLHGRRWRERAGVPPGRRPRHLATAVAAAVAVTAVGSRRPSLALAAGLVWAGQTAELAWARIAPGPRGRDEVVTMLATSAVLPMAATWHWLKGLATRWP